MLFYLKPGGQGSGDGDRSKQLYLAALISVETTQYVPVLPCLVALYCEGNIAVHGRKRF